jgi:hypothetical protein
VAGATLRQQQSATETEIKNERFFEWKTRDPLPRNMDLSSVSGGFAGDHDAWTVRLRQRASMTGTAGVVA